MTFNLYRAPTVARTKGDVSPWTSLIQFVYGAYAAHIVYFLAHRVQRPHEKINHALVLGGKPGIGKDTILEPTTHAVGPWNVGEVVASNIMAQFNPFVQSVIMRVNEAHDLGDISKYEFYERMKIYEASPPSVLMVNKKYIQPYAIMNVCGVIITTNHKHAGMYLPADDRRHYVAWSDRTPADFRDGYFDELYGWYASGGNEIVADYLATVDLAAFNPKAPPMKTRAFWEIVDAGRAAGSGEFADALERLNYPDVLTVDHLKDANPELFGWLSDPKNLKMIPVRMEECDYVRVDNPDAKDGKWRIGGRKLKVYAKRALSEHDRYAAARALVPVVPVVPVPHSLTLPLPPPLVQ